MSQQDPIKGAIESFKDLVDDAIKTAIEKEGDLVSELIALLSNWIDLGKLIGEYKDRLRHDLSGTLFIYIWRGYGWIIYEILSGHYLEALRDMRFLFEGAFLSIHLDYFIDRKVFEKARAFGTIGLKGEIWKLRDDLRELGFKLSSDKQEERERAKKSIRKKVRNYLEKLNLPDEKREEYENLYTEILLQPELYWSISKIIKEFCREFNVDTAQINRLKAVWDELSRYTHFSPKFVEIVLRDPYFLFVNDFNEELFKKCVDLAFTVFDVLCAIIAVHYPKIRNEIEKVLKWWEENSNKSFKLTETVLKNS